MADLAFIFDENKGNSDIQIVAGDFLLCDTVTNEVDEKESVWTENNIPPSISITGTGVTRVDSVHSIMSGQTNGKSYWTTPQEFGPDISYLNYNGSGSWEIFYLGSGETWTLQSTSDVPEKTGWSIGDLGSPAPTLIYDMPLTTSTSTYLVSSLQVAVELSLFTDRRATTAEIQQFQSGIQERQTRRGFWGNSFKEYTQGSGLWLLQREKKTNETLSRAKVFCNDSLQWLINTGVVSSVATETSFDGDALIIEVQITKPDGQVAGFKYQFSWDSLEAIQ